MDARISASLQSLAVDIDAVHPMKGNPRKGDVEAAKRSLVMFGQRKPIVAMADGTITAGHHLHAAAVQLGWQEVAVNFEDDDLLTAKAFALADNRTGDLGRYDTGLLLDQLHEVQAADAELLAATSYTDETILDLESLGPHQPSGDDGDPDDEGDNSASGKHCPHCGFPL